MSPVTVVASTTPTQAQQEFTRLLRELFQLDQSDLDFGIYRIMRMRAQDVEAFITDELPRALQAAREELATRGLDEVRAARDEARQQLQQNFGLDVASPEAVAAQEAALGAIPIFRDTLARYRAAQTQLDQAALAEELERTIYQDLYRFFARYYDSGDFVTQPRAGEAAYMLPYNGEEVKLYWANHDQYYIKTGENFRHYRFEVGHPTDDADLTRLTVEFELTDADTAAGNNLNKKGRVFLPASPDDYFQFDAEARRLTLRFSFAVPTPEEAERWGTKQSVAKDEKGVNERIIRDVAERIQATGDAYLIDFWRRNSHKRGEQPVNAFVYHLHRYTLPNHFDYFIHRNLGRFLGQELDYYLKHELLDLQFLGEDWSRPAQLQAVQQQLLRVSVVRGVALRLIAFLHELEEYQRHLFEKKKLVVGAEYCISLDLLSDTVRPAVLAHLLADTEPTRQQLRAWQTLGMVPDTAAGATALRYWLTGAQTTFDANAAYARLPFDTQYLTQAGTEAATTLRDDILGAFNDLDGQTTGVLINSENWQALNALQAKYREQIRCIPIDPPYNRLGDGFPYKDSFQHSSWLSMMIDRLRVSQKLLRLDGAVFVNIDENERQNLQESLNQTFGSDNRVEELIWAQNTTHSQSPLYSTNHEYVLVYARDKSVAQSIPTMFREPKPGYAEMMELVSQLNPNYPTVEEVEVAISELFQQHIQEFEQELSELNLEYNKETQKLDPWRGLYNYNRAEYRNKQGSLVPEDKAEAEQGILRIWRESDTSAPARKQSNSTRDPNDPNYRFYKPIHPVTKQPSPHPKTGWRFPFSWPDSNRESFESLDANNLIVWGEANEKDKVPQYKRFLHQVETNVAKSIFHDYTDGEKQVASLFGETGLFPTPKPTTLPARFIAQTCTVQDIILDYFAGSGTTGHAVLNLNRDDEGKRRFILVEMGEYFDTVTKPRVLKAAYSSTWQNGTAYAPTASMSQLVQVLRLEQYEDTLNNMEFAAVQDEEAKEFFADSPENRLRYVLARSESNSKPTLGPAQLTQPFGYELSIVLANERKPVAVDLVASFNLLLGLHVERLWAEHSPDNRRYRLVQGHRRGLRHLCIWRDAPGLGQPAEAEEVALEAERDWVQAQSWYQQAQTARAVVYCNAQQLFGAESTEAELHRLLFATV